MFIWLRRVINTNCFFRKIGQINFPDIELENCEKPIQYQIFILEIVLLSTDNMFCLSENLGVPKFMSLVLKFVFLVYKCF